MLGLFMMGPISSILHGCVKPIPSRVGLIKDTICQGKKEAWQIIKALAVFSLRAVASALTLGFAPALGTMEQQEQNARLRSRNIQRQEQLATLSTRHRDLITRTETVSQEIEQLRSRNDRLNDECERLVERRLAPLRARREQALQERRTVEREGRQQLDRLNRECEERQREIDRIEIDIRDVEIQMNHARRNHPHYDFADFTRLNNERAQAEEEFNQHLEMQRIYEETVLEYETGLAPLRRRRDQLTRELDEFRDELQSAQRERALYQESGEQLYARRNQLQNEIVRMQELYPSIERTGPVPLSYRPKADDPRSIRGAYESDSNYRFNGIGDMCTLLKEAAEHYAFSLVQRSASPGERLHVNRAAALLNQDHYINGIIAYTVLQLIRSAKLEDPQAAGACHGDPRLIFNDQGLAVQDSKPLNIAVQGNIRTIFQNPSSWAFEASDHLIDHTNGQKLGIEPVSVKLIDQQLDNAEKAHLENLLLDSFQPMDTALRRAMRFRDSGTERAHLVKTAYEQILNLVTALRNNSTVNTSSSILEGLGEVFDDYEAAAYERPAVANDAVFDGDDVLVEWTPDYTLIPDSLEQPVRELKERLSLLYSRIENLEQPPDRMFVARFTTEMHCVSECGMGAAGGVLFLRRPTRDEVNAIMELFANYLDNTNNAARFKGRILSNAHDGQVLLGRDEYGNSQHQNMGHRGTHYPSVEAFKAACRNHSVRIQTDLIFELLAASLGISIGMFQSSESGNRVDDYGMLQPPFFFDPPEGRTVERLYIRCSQDFAFYAAYPKFSLKTGVNDDELRQVVTDYRRQLGM